MKTISINRARAIASEWYNGGQSSLYQFQSSGVFVRERAALYVAEVQDCLNSPELARFPFTMPVKDRRTLNSLLRYFVNECNKVGVSVTIAPHSHYGYPVVSTDTPGVQNPTYPI